METLQANMVSSGSVKEPEEPQHLPDRAAPPGPSSEGTQAPPETPRTEKKNRMEGNNTVTELSKSFHCKLRLHDETELSEHHQRAPDSETPRGSRSWDNTPLQQPQTQTRAARVKTRRKLAFEKRPSKSSEEDTDEEIVAGLQKLSLNESTRKIKFLINVPMKVTLPDGDRKREHMMSQCQEFLELLQQTGFRKEDKERLNDVAVVFGLNGYHSDELRAFLDQMVVKIERTHLMFEKIAFTWGPGGNVAYDGKGIPYQLIRESIKNDKATEQLARDLRGEDETAVMYFSFIDADTVSFNQVYSSYLDLVREHSGRVGVTPTVMSTGYEFPDDSDMKLESKSDREIRILTAKHFPLGTYYPEPNFCVLLPHGEDKLPESFINKGDAQNMESPTLIKSVRKRTGFTIVFDHRNPIITQCKKNKYSKIAQSHCNPRTWAMSLYANGEIQWGKREQGNYYKTLGFLMTLLNSECEDIETAVQTFKKKCYKLKIVGRGSEEAVRAAFSVMKQKLQEEGRLSRDATDAAFKWNLLAGKRRDSKE